MRGGSSRQGGGQHRRLNPEREGQSGVTDGFACGSVPSHPQPLVMSTPILLCPSTPCSCCHCCCWWCHCCCCCCVCVHAVSGVLRVIMIAIADVVGKPPTESVFFEKYSRIACVIDEVLNEVSVGGCGWVGVAARGGGRVAVACGVRREG